MIPVVRATLCSFVILQLRMFHFGGRCVDNSQVVTPVWEQPFCTTPLIVYTQAAAAFLVAASDAAAVSLLSRRGEVEPCLRCCCADAWSAVEDSKRCCRQLQRPISCSACNMGTVGGFDVSDVFCSEGAMLGMFNSKEARGSAQW